MGRCSPSPLRGFSKWIPGPSAWSGGSWEGKEDLQGMGAAATGWWMGTQEGPLLGLSEIPGAIWASHSVSQASGGVSTHRNVVINRI